MIRENLNTGESINLDSPFISEQEAEMNASFGALLYGVQPVIESAKQKPPNNNMGLSPGGYGYNPTPYPQQQPMMMNNNPYMSDLSQQPHQFNNPYFNNPMYQSILQDSMRSMNQQQQQRQPVVSGYSVTPGIGNGIPGGYCPATFGDNSQAYTFNPYYNNNNYCSENQTYQIYVEPIRMNGEYMPFTDQEDRLNDIFAREINRNLDEEAEEDVGGFRPNGYFNISRRSTQFERELNELKNKCMENRRAFDIKLSKMAHHYLNDGVTDEEIEDMYNGYTIDTGLKMVNHNRRAALSNAVVVGDNHLDYLQADLAVTQKFYETIGVDPEHCDMKTFFDNIGAYGYAMAMEEEGKRRLKTRKFNESSFHYAMRLKKIENLKKKYGITSSQYLDQHNIANYGNSIMNFNNGTIVTPMHNPNFVNPALELLGQNQQPIQPVFDINNDADRDRIRQNLANFPTLAKATVSDDGTININYSQDDIREIMSGLSDDAINDEFEKGYEANRQAFIDNVFAPKEISPYYRPPDKGKNVSKGGG